MTRRHYVTKDGRIYWVMDRATGRAIYYAYREKNAEDFANMMSGWCSECGQYFEREIMTQPILDPDGQIHGHYPNPWKLLPEAQG